MRFVFLLICDHFCSFVSFYVTNFILCSLNDTVVEAQLSTTHITYSFQIERAIDQNRIPATVAQNRSTFLSLRLPLSTTFAT